MVLQEFRVILQRCCDQFICSCFSLCLKDASLGRALGGGDVKMMGAVGAFLGPWGVATTVFFGSLFALLVFGPISYLTKRLVPLGIFLAAGAALSYGWGDAILEWYRVEILGF